MFGVYRNRNDVWCLQERKRCLVFTGMETVFGVYRNGNDVWCLQEWDGCLVFTGMGRVFHRMGQPQEHEVQRQGPRQCDQHDLFVHGRRED